jgi:tripartite ATP-independent transporter DctM subunit
MAVQSPGNIGAAKDRGGVGSGGISEAWNWLRCGRQHAAVAIGAQSGAAGEVGRPDGDREIRSAAVTTSIVMFLVAAALVSSWLITVSEISTQIVDLLKPFMGNNTLLMFAIMVIVVIVGTALDMTPTILILTPILMPVIKTAGIDPVYFGVLFIINNVIGLITPPVGVVLNVVCGVSRISMEEVIEGVWPLMIAQLVVLFLMVLFPGLVTIPAKWFGG